MPGDLTRLARLWEKTSSKTGSTYLVGRLGGFRVLVMPRHSSTRDESSDHDWEILLTPADPVLPKPASDNRQPELAMPRRKSSPSSSSQSKLEDDPVPF
jgi:hypothetical protein